MARKAAARGGLALLGARAHLCLLQGSAGGPRGGPQAGGCRGWRWLRWADSRVAQHARPRSFGFLFQDLFLLAGFRVVIVYSERSMWNKTFYPPSQVFF